MAKSSPKVPNPTPLAPGITVALLAGAAVVLVMWLVQRRDSGGPNGGLHLVPDEPDEPSDDEGELITDAV